MAALAVDWALGLALEVDTGKGLALEMETECSSRRPMPLLVEPTPWRYEGTSPWRALRLCS
jgi:hypothetical protein